MEDKYFELMYQEVKEIMMKPCFRLPSQLTIEEKKQFLELLNITAEDANDYEFCEKIKKKLKNE